MILLEVYFKGEFIGTVTSHNKEFIDWTDEVNNQFGKENWDDYKVNKRFYE